MKILQVIHSVNPRGGGPIEGIRQITPALAALGVETEVLTLDAPDAPWCADFPVPLHAMGPSKTSYGYTPRAVPWLRENRSRFNAVFVNGLWQYPGFAVWRALAGTTTPYFVYCHGMLDPWFKRTYPLKHLKKWLYWPWGEYRVLRDASAVLFTAEEERRLARQSFWLYRANEVVTGYGITAPPDDLSRERELFLNRFPALRGRRLILFLGRVHVKKGCDLLLRAWQKVAPGPDVHLVMAGPTDHTYGQEMRALAASLGLGDSVTWTGMVSGDLKWGCLAGAEAFVLPSHQENFGLSVVEALACGVPVLISNQVNIWREIKAEGAGLVAQDDLAGTIQLLRDWIALPEEERSAYRQRARACFISHFEITHSAQSICKLLRQFTI